MLKSIAIMTSGGDSPGMNAAARAVVRTALYEGVKVFGIYDGYKGMLEDRIVELNSQYYPTWRYFLRYSSLPRIQTRRNS